LVGLGELVGLERFVVSAGCVFGWDPSSGRRVAVAGKRAAVAVTVSVAVGVWEAVRVAEAVRVEVLVSIAVDVLVRVSVGTGVPVAVGVEDALVIVKVTVDHSTLGGVGPASTEGSHHDKKAMKTRTNSRE
jgi:hypothetical protein